VFLLKDVAVSAKLFYAAGPQAESQWRALVPEGSRVSRASTRDESDPVEKSYPETRPGDREIRWICPPREARIPIMQLLCVTWWLKAR